MGHDRTRVVLDTNVLISALLFQGGSLSWLRAAWKNSASSDGFTPLLCPGTTRELIRVLGYPRFRLSPADVQALLEDLLPFAETEAADPHPDPRTVGLRDASDRIFLDLALERAADALVSGDADLVAFAAELPDVPILTPEAFRNWWMGRPFG